MAQKRSSLFELYPTDLERHLFTLRSSRRPTKPPVDEVIGKRFREWWLTGWARWKSTLAAIASL